MSFNLVTTREMSGRQPPDVRSVQRRWDSKVAVKIPFRYDDEFEHGKIQQISHLVRRIVANNPSRFTFRGTGTYAVGWG